MLCTQVKMEDAVVTKVSENSFLSSSEEEEEGMKAPELASLLQNLVSNLLFIPAVHLLTYYIYCLHNYFKVAVLDISLALKILSQSVHTLYCYIKQHQLII